MVFIILGTLQMFMLMQGRILAQYAAFRAVRVGSTNHGNCERMTHAAILSVIPAIEPFMGDRYSGTPGARLAQVFSKFRDNSYAGQLKVSFGGNETDYTGDIVWIARRTKAEDGLDAAEVRAFPQGQDTEFDQPFDAAGNPKDPMRLNVRMIFWFPMKIPFANWVMTAMFLANFRLQNYTAQNPWMLTQTAQWDGSEAPAIDLDRGLDIANEMQTRAGRREYVFPIEANYSMRMMTPAKAANFADQNCPPTRTN